MKSEMKSVSMNNQELVLKQVNAVVAVIISMIHMQNCVLMMLLKI